MRLTSRTGLSDLSNVGLLYCLLGLLVLSGASLQAEAASGGGSPTAIATGTPASGSGTSELSWVTGVSVTPSQIASTTSSATIHYTLNVRSNVTIFVYDKDKNRVRTLPQGVLNTGAKSAYWNCKDSHNIRVSPGTYTIEINATAVNPTYVDAGRIGADSPGSSSYLDAPAYVAVGSSNLHIVYVADRMDFTLINEFHYYYYYHNDWGDSGDGDGEIGVVNGIAIGPGDVIYTIDGANNRVQKYTDDGSYLLKWGSTGSGNYKFTNPRGIAVDRSGNVYVADTGNNKIKKYTSSGTYVTSWSAGSSAEPPTDLAVDSAGNVYVISNKSFRVTKYTTAGAAAAIWGVEGSSDGRSSQLGGIAIGPDDCVYLTDLPTGRVQKFTSDGTFLCNVRDMSAGAATFSYPSDLTVDSQGHVFVCDKSNHRVLVFSPVFSSQKGTATVKVLAPATSTPAAGPTVSAGTATPTAASSAVESTTGTTEPVDVTPTEAATGDGGDQVASTGGDHAEGGSGGTAGQVTGDTAMPVTVIALNGAQGNTTDTYTSDVQVVLAASDGDGSGVRETQYSFDGINWVQYTAPFTVTGEGQTTVYARSVDNAGNTETAKTATFSIAKSGKSSASFCCVAVLWPLLVVGIVTLGAAKGKRRQ